MKLYIVHYYNNMQYEEHLEIKAICTSEINAKELCKELNQGRTAYYNYVIVDSDEEFDDSILRW